MTKSTRSRAVDGGPCMMHKMSMYTGEKNHRQGEGLAAGMPQLGQTIAFGRDASAKTDNGLRQRCLGQDRQ